jgi:hypothetical protein
MSGIPLSLGYNPQCVVNFTIRYDEAIQVAENPGDLQRATETGELGLRTGGKLGRQFRPRIRVGTIQSEGFDSAGNLVTQSFVSDQTVEDTGGRSLAPLTYGGDKLTVVLDRVPKRGSFVLPHPRQAATFNLILDYRDIPIDPRLVRALGVEVHLGCVSMGDYSAGMGGKVDAGGRSRSLLRTRSGLLDPRTGNPAPRDQTLLFYGSADTWTVDHDDTGSWVTIEGRDIRGIFLDGKPPANVLDKIDLTRPIHRVIADLIATIPYDVSIAVDVLTVESEWPNGVVPSPGDVKGFTRVKLGSSGSSPQSGAGGGGASGSKPSYWDLITNFCNLLGAIPYFEGSTIWIRPARSIFDTAIDTSETPFASPRFIGEDQLSLRRLVWGRNVKKLSFARKFGGVTVPAVEVIGFDDQAKGMARYPRGLWPPTSTVAAQSKNSNDILRVPMANIRDPRRLVEVARDVYEEIGRGEIGGSAETYELASFGGDNADPDMLRLRPTNAIEIVVDNDRPTPLSSKTFQAEVADVYARIGDLDAARAIVTANRGAAVGVLDMFRVSKVTYDWGGTESGIKVGLEFQNYIVARHAADPNEERRQPRGKKRASAKSRAEDRKRKARGRVSVGKATAGGFGSASGGERSPPDLGNMTPSEVREYVRDTTRRERAATAGAQRDNVGRNF